MTRGHYGWDQADCGVELDLLQQHSPPLGGEEAPVCTWDTSPAPRGTHASSQVPQKSPAFCMRQGGPSLSVTVIVRPAYGAAAVLSLLSHGRKRVGRAS